MYEELYYDLHPLTNMAFEVYPKSIEKSDNELLNIAKSQTIDLDQRDFFDRLEKLIDSKVAIKLFNFSNDSLLIEYVESNDLNLFLGEELQENENIKTITQNIKFSPSVMHHVYFRVRMNRLISKYNSVFKETQNNINTILNRKRVNEENKKKTWNSIYDYCINGNVEGLDEEEAKLVHDYVNTNDGLNDAYTINLNYAPNSYQKLLTSTTLASTFVAMAAPVIIYNKSDNIPASIAAFAAAGAVTIGQSIYSKRYAKKRAKQVVDNMSEELEENYNLSKTKRGR